MRSKIRGKTLDTETADLIVEVSGNDDDCPDYHDEAFEYTCGLYYRPLARDFFLAGSGGIFTMFRGRSRCYCIDRDEAKAFALRYHADPEKMRKYFPE